jgi:tetratricopeptide (TPR) repeat protein
MKPRVFVVMPFGLKEVKAAETPQNGAPTASVMVDFNLVYDLLLAPALTLAGCMPFRADQELRAGDIRIDMFFELITADFVLADISILNANVFYELGVRHTARPRGVLSIHAGWSKLPFDIGPDRAFAYEGRLFEPAYRASLSDAEWKQQLDRAVTALATRLKAAIQADEQGVDSPVYATLPGLEPLDWSRIESAKAQYFGLLFDDWKGRVEVAQRRGDAGDILTLADDAPSRYHYQKLLMLAARALIALDRNSAAKHILEELLQLNPKSLEARSQYGLVQGCLGDIAGAEITLRNLAQQYVNDPEAQGILGRVYKDMWRQKWETHHTLPERRKAAAAASVSAVRAIKSYYAAQRRHLDSYYNGINVLGLTRLLNHLREQTDYPVEKPGVADLPALTAVVRMAAQCAAGIDMPDSGSQEEVIWGTATLGELELLAGQEKKAMAYYQSAANSPDATYFQVASMLNQLRTYELLGFQSDLVGRVNALLEERQRDFSRPCYEKVCIFSGHMIDRPERSAPRFPARKESIVRERIAAQLDQWGIGDGDLAIVGGACGGDILFAELCVERGAQVWLFISMPQDEFLPESVRFAGGDWEERYFKLREHPHVQTSFQHDRIGFPVGDASPHARNNVWIINTARVEARPNRLYGLLLWDEKPAGDGPGGTADFAASVKHFEGRLQIIDPMALPDP